MPFTIRNQILGRGDLLVHEVLTCGAYDPSPDIKGVKRHGRAEDGAGGECEYSAARSYRDLFDTEGGSDL